MEFHPAANSFPMMDEKRLSELMADIERRGQQVKIVIADGMVLDGRNRWAACEKLGREPETIQFTGGNPWDYVWSMNGERRDLTGGDEQRYLIWKHCSEQGAAWQAKQKAIADEANRKRSEAAKGNQNAAKLPPKTPASEPQKTVVRHFVEQPFSRRDKGNQGKDSNHVQIRR